MNAAHGLFSSIVQRLHGEIQPGGAAKARCPAHNDRNPSLSIWQKADGSVGLKCHAGCSWERVLRAGGLEKRDLYPRNGGGGVRLPNPKTRKEPRSWWDDADRALHDLDVMQRREGRKRVKVWAYTDARGVVRAKVVRYQGDDGGKTYRPISEWAEGKWALTDPPDLWPLYNLPRLARAGRVFVVEGEKCADALNGLGLTATTSAHGAKSAGETDWAPLAGKELIVIPDDDPAGLGYVRDVSRITAGLSPPATVKTLDLDFPGRKEGDDVVDYLAFHRGRGRTDARLAKRIGKLADEAEGSDPAVSAGTGGPGTRGGAEGDGRDLSEQNRTEAANARRLAARCGRDLHWCDPWGKWLLWDGARWKVDDAVRVERLAKDAARDLWAEYRAVAGLLRADERNAVRSFCKSSNSATGVKNALSLTRSEPGLPVVPSQLDRDPWAVGVLNGTLDLRRAALRPHRREDLITKMCPVEYDPAAACPLWLKFLERVLDGNAALIEYLRRVVGYCLTGDVCEQCMWFLHGGGGNGKSTFLGVVLALMGDYGCQAAPDLLTAKTHESHPTEVADLFGKRFISTVEVDQGKRLAESLFKQLTGGDRLKARRMREDFWEFDPTHKLFLAANHKPEVRGSDEAVWRRIKLVPFTVTIPDAEKDKALPAKLKAELPGVLAWAVRGCLDWQSDGLREPEEVRAATAEYRKESDSIGRFLEERCTLREDARVRASGLHDAFREWSGTGCTARELAARLRKGIHKCPRPEREHLGRDRIGRMKLTQPLASRRLS